MEGDAAELGGLVASLVWEWWRDGWRDEGREEVLRGYYGCGGGENSLGCRKGERGRTSEGESRACCSTSGAWCGGSLELMCLFFALDEEVRRGV